MTKTTGWGFASNRIQKQISRLDHENRTTIFGHLPLVLSPPPHMFSTEASWGGGVCGVTICWQISTSLYSFSLIRMNFHCEMGRRSPTLLLSHEKTPVLLVWFLVASCEGTWRSYCARQCPGPLAVLSLCHSQFWRSNSSAYCFPFQISNSWRFDRHLPVF